MKPHGVAGGRLRHVFHIVLLVNVDPYRRDQSPHHVTCHVVNHLAVELCMCVWVLVLNQKLHSTGFQHSVSSGSSQLLHIVSFFDSLQ